MYITDGFCANYLSERLVGIWGSKMFKPVVLVVTFTLLLIAPLFLSVNITEAAGTATIRMVEASSGSSSIIVGNASERIPSGGIPFSLKVFLNGSTADLATWQVLATFDNNTLKCTNGLVPENDSSYVFYGIPEVSAVDLDHQNWVPPQVAAGAAVINLTQTATINDSLLCTFTFRAIRVGNTTIQISRESTDTFLLDSNIHDISFATQDFSVSVLGTGSPPVAGFSFHPVTPKTNETVTFDASSSDDPDGRPIMNYTWRFGDNISTVTSTLIATYAYSRRGFFEVNLTVTDSEGAYDSTARRIQVGTPPIANLTYLPASPRLGEMMTFNATGSRAADEGVSIISYEWAFDDVYPSNVTTTTSGTIAHTYPTAGNYSVMVTVYDSDGLHNSAFVLFSLTAPQSPFAFLTPLFIAAVLAVVALAVLIVVIVYRRRPRRHARLASRKTESPRITRQQF